MENPVETQESERPQTHETEKEKVDLAYSTELQGDPKKNIQSGFFWIGIASVVAQILSALVSIIAMIFMTKEDMGQATLVVSFVVILEAFQSLGTDKAFLQVKELSSQETDSLFWFNSGLGLLVFLVLTPFAWIFAQYYGNSTLIPLFIVGLLKFPLCCFSSIPYNLINRRFEYQKISVIKTLTLLFCGITKIVLAIVGFGPFAIVIGEVLHPIGLLTGGMIYSRYRPKLHFKFGECRRFIRFGIKHCLSECLSQFNKNLHFLVVGKLLGEGTLGIYKVSFELAMTPALALFDVVAKSSFPIFSRIQDKRRELSELFLWNQRNIALFAAIPIVAILFAAQDIFGLMPSGEWIEAVAIIPYVLVLSFFRSILQAYPDLFRACGHPEYPIFTNGLEAVLFLVAAVPAITSFPAHGLEAMIAVWILVLLSFFGIFIRIGKKFIDISVGKIISSIRHGLAFTVLGCVISIPAWLIRDRLPYANWTHIGLEVISILVSIALYARFVLKISIRDFLKRKKA